MPSPTLVNIYFNAFNFTLLPWGYSYSVLHMKKPRCIGVKY